MSLFSEAVTLQRRGDVVGRTSTNDPICGPPVSVELAGWVETGFGGEQVILADQVTKDYTLWLDGDHAAELDAYDDVIYRGHLFHIAGDVAYQAGGTVVPGWTNARLEKVSG